MIKMKKYLLIIPLFIFFVSCQQKIEKTDIVKINGYWEITKVTSDDGKEKNYSINETIDYFEIKNNSGFRKKVTPQFDGKYLVNDVFETIKIVSENGKTNIFYTTPYSKWKEEIITLTDTELVLKNEQKIQYNYKRPTPFSVK